MGEQSFREIQLSRKQLVFLFMASVVVAIAIFLLGISVGRGVRNASMAGTTAVEVASDREPVAPAVMPPATQTTPADLSYHDQLQGQTPPSASSAPASGGNTAAAAAPAEPPSPVQDAPPADQAAHATSQATPPATVKTADAKPAVPPAPKPAAADTSASKTDATKAPPAASGWVVQVGTFSSHDNADRLVTRLKGKGYTAFMLPGSQGKTFRVRVGPFTARSDAQHAAERIQREEGVKPSVTR